MLAITLDANHWPDWLMYISIGIGVAAWHGRAFDWRRIPFAVMNTLVAWACLSWFGAYNSVLLLGGWLLVTQIVLRWWRPLHLWSVVMVLINLGISVALLSATPDTNGIVLKTAGLQASTHFGLYRHDERDFRVVERSQDFRRPSGGMQRIKLHSPVAGRAGKQVRLLIKPNRSVETRLVSLHMMSFAGFDGRPIKRLEGEPLLELVRASGIDATLRHTQVVIPAQNKATWIDLTLQREETRSVAPSLSLRAIVYWQIIFFLCWFFTPRGLPVFRGERVPQLPTRIPWWLWSSVVHVLFIAALWPVAMRGFRNDELTFRLVPFSLAHEGNYAVWWSGFCLLLSAFLYYHLGSLRQGELRDRIMWLSLAATMAALSADEVASLHERVSLLGGWWALLPFALIGACAFLYAIFRMLKQPGQRASASLVLLSLLLFMVVAGLEELESSWKFSNVDIARGRLVLEEAVELLASSLLLLSAVLQIARIHECSVSKVPIHVNPQGLVALPHLLFLLLVLHLLVTMLWMPVLWTSGLGDPAYWFPMVAYLVSMFHCLHLWHRGLGPRWHSFAGIVLFALLSAGQLFDHSDLIKTWLPFIPEQWFSSGQSRQLWVLGGSIMWLSFYLYWRQTLVFIFIAGSLMLAFRNAWHLFETEYMFTGLIAYFTAFLVLRKRPAS